MSSMSLRHSRFSLALLVGLLLVALGSPSSTAEARPGRAAKGKVVKGNRKAKARSTSLKRSTGTRTRAKTSLLSAKKGDGKWQKRRVQDASDTGLKDHASRHSELTPKEYLQLGQLNMSKGRMLKGGGKHGDARYYVRKVGDGQYSMTITNRRGKILSIDTWKAQGAPLTKESLQKGFKSSGVTPPKGFWSSL